MITILLVLYLGTVDVLSSPAINLYKCKTSDDACVVRAVQVAYPLILEANAAIDAEAMDPMYHNLIGQDYPNFMFRLINTTVVGFKICEIKKARYNEVPETIQIELLCPNFRLEGQYIMKGMLIDLPVEGNGDYVLLTNGYRLEVDLNLTTIVTDGKSYKTIDSFKVKPEVLDKMTFDLKNLFNGQEELAAPALKFINEHSIEVSKAVQDAVFTAHVTKLVNNANKYLKTLSIDQYIPQ